MEMPTVHFRNVVTRSHTLCGRPAWKVLHWYEKSKVTCRACRKLAGLKVRQTKD